MSFHPAITLAQLKNRVKWVSAILFETARRLVIDSELHARGAPENHHP